MERGPQGFRLSAVVQIDDGAREIYFSTRDVELPCRMDPFVPIALPAAMLWRRPLLVEGPVSPLLLARLPELQRIFSEKERTLRPVQVIAPERTVEAPAPGRGTGLFFSGGVDSFYSLLEHEAEISHLVFVHGFDLHVEQEELHRTVFAALAGAAESFGKPLIHVETNLREFTDRCGDWANHFHGPTKAGTALALGSVLGRVLCSGESVAPDQQDSSRIELDPLWSTEEVEVAHVGHLTTRFEKLRRIGGDPRVQQHLRVCWENRGGEYNCGRCTKCLRNMSALRALGYLDQVTTFAQPLDLQVVANEMRISRPLHREELRAILSHLRENRSDPALAEAVTASLRAYYRYAAVKPYRSVLGRVLRGAKRLLSGG